MTDEQMRIAVAEWCGAKQNEHGVWKTPSGTMDGRTTPDCLPDYCNDLNAMHEVESKLIEYTVIETFLRHLKNRVAPHNDWEELLAVWCLTHATAAQRAEALLKTIGKWKE